MKRILLGLFMLGFGVCAYAQSVTPLVVYCNHNLSIACTTASPGTSPSYWDPPWLVAGKENFNWNNIDGILSGDVIPAPSSAINTFTLTGTTSALSGNEGGILSIVSNVGATTASDDFIISRNGSTANVFKEGPDLVLYDRTNSQFGLIQWSGNQLEIYPNGTQAAFWNSNRGLVLNAPSSGAALAVTGVAASSTAAIAVTEGNAGTAIGLQILGCGACGTTNQLQVSDTGNSNGANIKIIGNGGTTPSKTIRVQSGVFQILNDGYTASLKTITDSGVDIMVGFTVATLPTCNASTKGGMAYVTDATTPTYNATLTGGSNVIVPVFCNGTAWTSH